MLTSGADLADQSWKKLWPDVEAGNQTAIT